MRTQPQRRIPSDRVMRTVSAAWPAILLASLITLPFLGKAHTIDDVTFLLQAKHVLTDPLHPAAFEMLSDHNRIRVSNQLVSGPVMAYLLVPSMLLNGAEWAAHLVQYLLLIGAILATVSLAFRLGMDGPSARVAGLILASTPVVTAMATTSMPDVASMAFGATGMERFVAWTGERKWHQGFLASVCFAFAALSRPHLILLLAAAAVALSRHPMPTLRARLQTPKAWQLLIPLIFAGLITLAAAIGTADPAAAHGDFIQAVISRFQPTSTASNTAAFFLHWSLVFPLTLLWLTMGVRRWNLWRNPALYAALALTFFIRNLDKGSQKVPQSVLFLAFIGAFVLLDILLDSWERRDNAQLLLWVWLLISLPAIAYVQFPSKYLVGSAPAVAVLLAGVWMRSGRLRHVIPWVAVSAGVVLGLLIVAADARFAAIGKTIAADQIAPRVRQGTRVWINSEWGFEWYALKAGAVPATNQPPYPAPGDLLVSSSAAPHLPLDRFPNRKLVAEFRESSRFGQIMNHSAAVGFYSNAYGYFPWTWRNGEIEAVTIWEIR